MRALAIPAPTSRSFAFVVVTDPLLAVVLVPLAVATTSNGLFVSRPLYSAIRMSTDICVVGVCVFCVNVTVIVLLAAVAIFLA